MGNRKIVTQQIFKHSFHSSDFGAHPQNEEQQAHETILKGAIRLHENKVQHKYH
jgi:hypothetical protein